MRLTDLLAEIIDRVPASPEDRHRMHGQLRMIDYDLRYPPKPEAPAQPSETRPLWGSDGPASYFGDGTPVPEHLPPQED